MSNSTYINEDHEPESLGLFVDGAEEAEEKAFRKQQAEQQDDFDNFEGGDEGEYDLLGELLEEAAEETQNLVKFPVSIRPHWVLEFDAVITDSELKRYRKNAEIGKRRRGRDGEISTVLMYGQLLSEKSVAIYKRGEDGELALVEDSQGDPLTLRSEEFLDGFGQDVRAAVRKFLGDAGTGSMGGAVLAESGWTEDLTPLDPTER